MNYFRCGVEHGGFSRTVIFHVLKVGYWICKKGMRAVESTLLTEDPFL